VAVVVCSLSSAGWGTLEDLAYKTKPIDGSLWCDLHGRGSTIDGREAERQIMFSFDDGPDHRSTPVLLDHLDRYGIKAVFFVNGHRMHERRPDAAENLAVLRDIHRRGHVIGNHTYNHRDLSAMSDDEIRREVDSTSRLVEKVTGQRTWLFRPPFGKIGAAARHLATQGYTTVMWSVDPLDWQTSDPQEVKRRVIDRLLDSGAGGVIDLHDTNRATVEAFPLVVEWIEQRNAELAAMGRPQYRIVGVESFYRRQGRR
jgi:peptidoglycan/xylan/chitin deacetylase (PgdA/CDA1 family)